MNRTTSVSERSGVISIEHRERRSDAELLESARAGDDEAIVALLNRYRHYARAKTRTYFLVGADKDDIVQEGMIGLFKAIRDYETSKEVEFRAFAELCITRQIISAIKGATRRKHTPLNSYVSLNQPTGDIEDEETVTDLFAARPVPDPADLVISSEEISVVRSTLGKILSRFEAEVLQLYMEGRSYQEIAELMGRHVKSVDNALQRIKRKLGDYVSRRGLGTRPEHPASGRSVSAAAPDDDDL